MYLVRVGEGGGSPPPPLPGVERPAKELGGGVEVLHRDPRGVLAGDVHPLEVLREEGRGVHLVLAGGGEGRCIGRAKADVVQGSHLGIVLPPVGVCRARALALLHPGVQSGTAGEGGVHYTLSGAPGTCRHGKLASRRS